MDDPREVIVIGTGVSNVASITCALERAGCIPKVSLDPEEIVRAALVVLPGVGAFGAAMERLHLQHLDRAILDRIERARPLLAICLGLQLLCESSEESPGVAGLGVIPGRVTRLEGGPGMPVPHLGWNVVTPGPRPAIAETGRAYFANSYALRAPPGPEGGWTSSFCEYGRSFVAALRRGPLLACQFHPELSGPWGAALIRRWVDTSAPEKEPLCSLAV